MAGFEYKFCELSDKQTAFHGSCKFRELEDLHYALPSTIHHNGLEEVGVGECLG